MNKRMTVAVMYVPLVDEKRKQENKSGLLASSAGLNSSYTCKKWIL